eukprot:SAG31_NODE_12481_length_938_cov_1.750894_1_plen_97_part_01
MLMAAAALVPGASGQMCGSLSTTRLTDSGSIRRGRRDYEANADCRWELRCRTAGQHAELTFSSFQTEYNFDFVTVFDGETTRAPQLAQLSGCGRPHA